MAPGTVKKGLIKGTRSEGKGDPTMTMPGGDDITGGVGVLATRSQLALSCGNTPDGPTQS